MLIMANGAFKSGSTWLRNIASEMTSFERVPKQYQHPDLSHWIFDERLPNFLAEVDCKSRNYITKSHILNPKIRDLLLGHESVRVLGIERDIRDVLVSHYYHMSRLKQFGSSKDFEHYYWTVGRYKAHQIRVYHIVWETQSPRLFKTKFELLKENFEAEVARLGDFLGISLDMKEIERIKHVTSLGVQRKLWGEEDRGEDNRFFRKGLIGESQKYFDEEMNSDIQSVYQSGLSGLSLLKYHALFSCRQGLNSAISRARYLFRR